MAEFLRVTAAAQTISRWSGGTTAQLAIEPPKAVYADHDFIWRISSATVENETSVFSPLPDYDRVILTLSGEMTLVHNGGAPIALSPLSPHRFCGSWKTESTGKVTDFNLMTRKGACTGEVEPIVLSGGSRILLQSRSNGAFARTERMVYCAKGRLDIACGDEQKTMHAGELATRQGAGGASGAMRLSACDGEAIALVVSVSY